MILLFGALIFLTDGVSAFMAGRYLDARQDARENGDWLRVVLWDGALEVVLGVNIVSFIAIGWQALPFSVFGSMLGTGLSIARRK